MGDVFADAVRGGHALDMESENSDHDDSSASNFTPRKRSRERGTSRGGMCGGSLSGGHGEGDISAPKPGAGPDDVYESPRNARARKRTLDDDSNEKQKRTGMGWQSIPGAEFLCVSVEEQFVKDYGEKHAAGRGYKRAGSTNFVKSTSTHVRLYSCMYKGCPHKLKVEVC